MVDLEKERVAFEKCMMQTYSKHPEYFGKNEDGTYRNVITYGAWIGWQKKAILENTEITALKEKLAKIESGEFVVVPREPTEQMIYAGYESKNHVDNLVVNYKAMIEAQENGDEK